MEASASCIHRQGDTEPHRLTGFYRDCSIARQEPYRDSTDALTVDRVTI